MMKTFWLLLLATTAGGGVYVAWHVQPPPALPAPALAYWQQANRLAEAGYRQLQRGVDVQPGGTRPAHQQGMDTCQTPVARIVLEGIRQLDADRLQRELPVLEGRPFRMGDGLNLLKQVRAAYQRAALPPPVLSLRLGEVCHGVVRIHVSEDTLPPPAASSDALMDSLLADVREMVAPPPAPPAPRVRRMPALRGKASAAPHPAPSRPMRVEDAFVASGGLGVAMPQPPEEPPAKVTADAPTTPATAPAGGWQDARADTTATPLDDPASLVQRSQDDLLLLELWLNGTRLLEGFDAYAAREPGQAWLPLGLLMRTLEFPVEVDAGAGTARGWFLDEDNTLQLDTSRRQLVVKGKEVAYPDGRIERHADDLYIHSTLLAELFGLDGVLDFADLRYTLTSRTPLPAERKLAREADWRALERQRQLELAREVSNATVLPYAWLGQPGIRLDGGMNATHSSGQGTNTNSHLTVQAQGDMAKASGNFTVTLEDSADKGTRLAGGTLALTRQEMTPSLLGPLKATTLMAGDIEATRVGLADISTQGRGVRVSNQPFGSTRDPDRFVIVGDAPVGWDVEVYQNQALLAFQRVDASGRYRFDALPLKAGLNVFRIVAYGPHGEQRERLERYFLGGDMLARGTMQYDASLFQPNARLLPLDDQPKATTDSPWLLAQRFDYGLTNDITLQAGTYGMVRSGNDAKARSQQGLTGGLRASYGPMYLTADLLARDDDARTLNATLRGSLGDATDMRVGYSRFDGYSANEQPLAAQYDADLNTSFNLGPVGVGNSLGYTLEERLDGQRVQRASHRLGLGYQRFSFSHSMEHAWSDSTSTWSGQADLSGVFDGFSLRGSMIYTPNEQQVLRNALLNLNVPLEHDMILDASLLHVPGVAAHTELTNTLRFSWGSYTVGLQGRGDTRGNMGMGLTFGTQFVPTDSGGYKQEHPAYSSNAARALVRVFIDRNGNHRYDDGEPTVPGVTLYNRSRASSHATDAQGFATVDNLPSYSTVKIGMEVATLPDILLQPYTPDIAIIAHPGASGMADFPLQLFGEVNGTLYQHEGEVVRPVSNMVVDVVDARGQVVDYAVTDRDGFFAVAPLPLGDYRLQLRADEAARAGYKLVEPVPVTLTADANIRDDVQVAVTPLALPATPQAGDAVMDGVKVVY